MTALARKRSKDEDGMPNPVDVHVGRQLRLRRTLLGMSQEKLGTELGLTFQQVQKYERGANRIGASRLFELGRALDVPVGYFFEGAANEAHALAEEPAAFQGEPVSQREGLELLRIYNSIRDPEVRRNVLNLVKSVARSAQSESDKSAK